MENRAAVFTRQPQAVEVYQAGAWWAGELLGWRHEADGTCQVQVRVVLAGVAETAWTDLGTLRLPERHLSVAPEPASTGPVAREMSPAHPAGSRRHRAVSDDPAATSGLPMVRDLAVVSPLAASPRPGGRRRAPEETQAASISSAGVATGVVPGRHRAPAVAAGDAGRHRAADTGLIPVVGGPAAPGRATPAVPPARAPRSEEGRWSHVHGPDAEPDLFTRPMRLSDHVPHARRPRLDGALRSI
jgi:hypothetical protein